MACTLVFYYSSSVNSNDISVTLPGEAISFGDVIYSNGNRWSDIDVSFDDGSTQRIALIRNSGATHTVSNIRLEGCNPQVQESIKYDCINGACTKKTVYNTPGVYQSLEECEINCGTGCSGKCISNSDWAKIEGLAAQLKNKNCS